MVLDPFKRTLQPMRLMLAQAISVQEETTNELEFTRMNLSREHSWDAAVQSPFGGRRRAFKNVLPDAVFITSHLINA